MELLFSIKTKFVICFYFVIFDVDDIPPGTWRELKLYMHWYTISIFWFVYISWNFKLIWYNLMLLLLFISNKAVFKKTDLMVKTDLRFGFAIVVLAMIPPNYVKSFSCKVYSKQFNLYFKTWCSSFYGNI